MSLEVLEKIVRQVTPPVLLGLARDLRWRFSREWHRQVIGGLWEQMGKIQFDFMVNEGLKSEHKLLDIGCGSLRGGVRFIEWLEAGNYVGVDKEQRRLDAGRRFELRSKELQAKNPRLCHMEEFEFESIGMMFDFAIAQSVFTHLPLNSIIRCVLNVEKVLAVGGKFYATFFENPAGKLNLEPVVHRQGEPPTHFDRNPFHYDVATFEHICEGTNLRVKYIGDWGHPRGQKMVVFIKQDASVKSSG